MKNIFFLAALFILRQDIAEAQDFVDDFSDGDFSSAPVWSGETDHFTVEPALRLQLNGDCDDGGTDHLSAACNTMDSVTWAFNVQCDFDPSASNYACIYLQSNNADLQAPLNGYYVRIGGESGSADAVELYRQEGTAHTLVFRGVDGNAALSPHLGVKVVRTAVAEWKLFVDTGGGTGYVFEGSAVDDAVHGGAYMGVVCTYSSTRCQSFYFDDFSIGPLFTDTDAPVLQSVSAIASDMLELTFNEAVDPLSAETPSNYFVDGGVGSPLDAVPDVSDPTKVFIMFAGEFPMGIPLVLSVADIADTLGNSIELQSMEFTYITIGIFDVVIDEIFADPEPVIGLPEAEFIELYNTTPFDIPLQGWYLTDASGTSGVFPIIVLPADSFIIVTDVENADLFSAHGIVAAVNNFPALNNEGDDLTLFSPDGMAVHRVQYANTWYRDVLKDDGGYSLEMIDVSNTCQGIENWKASEDTNGGTPGEINSVAASNPDVVSPALLNVYLQSTDSLLVYFDEGVLSTTVQTTSFFIDNDIGNPISVISDGSVVNSVLLQLPTAVSPGVVYTLTASGISDCSGNAMMLNNTAQFGITEDILRGDIVINEILFNPVTDGYDYVELYNMSSKILNLADLFIIELNRDDTTQISEYAAISTSDRLFFPGDYVLLTQDVAQVAQQYNRIDLSNFVAVSGMPNYPDDAGVALIQTTEMLRIDMLMYDADWHYPLLEADDGVALERIAFNAPTDEAANWHSAAELVGYGTPGYQNSNYNAAVIADNLLQLPYTVFSPDGDGYRDLLMITYKTEAAGFIANIRIFDDAGRPLATILNNATLAREGFITWDGVLDDGRRAPMGIYFLYAEFFNMDGVVAKQRKKFTLIRKYD